MGSKITEIQTINKAFLTEQLEGLMEKEKNEITKGKTGQKFELGAVRQHKVKIQTYVLHNDSGVKCSALFQLQVIQTIQDANMYIVTVT